jgi:hypothetical protein
MTIETRTPDLPASQRNANVDDGLLIRVGIPHRSGKLAFHAFNEGYAAMVSASAFWNPKTCQFNIPDATDLSEIDFSLDSAGCSFRRRGGRRALPGSIHGR